LKGRRTDERNDAADSAAELCQRRPSRFARREGDGYLTLDAPWIVPALLSALTVEGPVLEPAAGRGHLLLTLKHAGLAVTSLYLRRIRALTSLKGFAWTITNLPYCDLGALAEWLIDLHARDRRATALLVRAESIVPRARRALVHAHPHFAGVLGPHLRGRTRRCCGTKLKIS
jgi:hypothetical protein